MNIDTTLDFELKGLKRYSRNILDGYRITKILTSGGKEMVRNLRDNTPGVDTGAVRDAWEYKIEDNELAIYNRAHSEESINIAIALDYGYGHNHGGFTPARPYIKKSVRLPKININKDLERLLKHG